MGLRRTIPHAIRSRYRMPSVPLTALGRTVPVQHPGGFVIARLEEVGADRLRQDRTVDDQRDVIAGLFACAFPARADLRPVAITEMDAVVRRVLGIALLGR